MCCKNEIEAAPWIDRNPFQDAERVRIDRIFLEVDLGNRKILREVKFTPSFLWAGDMIQLNWRLADQDPNAVHVRAGPHPASGDPEVIELTS